MKQNSARRGFTLIELLVVVIIIAILAAIALPQYQKAVMKSRFAALKPLAKAVKDAQEIYFNREGKYAGESELADLDIGIPEGTSLDISATGDHLYVRANNPMGLPHNGYTAYFNQSKNFAGNIYCEAYTGDTVAENLCINEGGTAGPTNGEYTLYLLSGNSTGSFSTGLAPSATNVQCPHLGYGTCNVYTLNNSHTLEIRTDYGIMGVIEVTEYDENGNWVNGSDFYEDGRYYEGSSSYPYGQSLCEWQPTLDICNN